MNKNIEQYRKTVFIITGEEEFIPVDFIKMDNGMFRVEELPKLNANTVGLYIPYLSFETLDKAYILKYNLEMNNIMVVETIISYFSICNDSNLGDFANHCRSILGNIFVIEGYINEEFIGNNIPASSILPCLLNNFKEDYIIVSANSNIEELNALNIKPHLYLNDEGYINSMHPTKDKIIIETLSGKVRDGQDIIFIKNTLTSYTINEDDVGALQYYYPNSKIIVIAAHTLVGENDIEKLKKIGIDRIITSTSCYPEGEYYDGFLKVY